MNTPEVLEADWPELEAWLRRLAEEVEFDAIVGVSRSGLPLAVALSFLKPTISLSIFSRVGPRVPKPQFYDFGADRDARIATLRSTFELTSLGAEPRNILIVDDVATLGDTFAVAREKVLACAPDAQVRFASYAVDEARLKSANPDVAARLSACLSVDNAKLWVSFPWNLKP